MKKYCYVTEKYGKELIFPDYRELMKDWIDEQEEICFPVNHRRGKLALWEIGGKSLHYRTSLCTIIADENDGVPRIVVVNKKNRRPNSRQALVRLKPGYHVYIGKIVSGSKLSVKILKLKFLDHQPIGSKTAVRMGRFRVESVINSIAGAYLSTPMQFLIRKLNRVNVIRPFYADGWSSTVLNKDLSWLDTYSAIFTNLDAAYMTLDCSHMLQAVMDDISRRYQRHLSAVLQVFDMNSMHTIMTPLIGFRLNDIENSAKNICIESSYYAKLMPEDTYGLQATFGFSDAKELKAYLDIEHNHTTCVMEDGVYACLRGWKG